LIMESDLDHKEKKLKDKEERMRRAEEMRRTSMERIENRSRYDYLKRERAY